MIYFIMMRLFIRKADDVLFIHLNRAVRFCFSDIIFGEVQFEFDIPGIVIDMEFIVS